MNKKSLLIVVLIILLGLGVTAYFYSTSTKKQSSQQSSQIEANTMETNDDQKNDVSKVNSTLAELVKLGKDYQCTYDYNDESNNHLIGTVYIANAGHRMKGNFVMEQASGSSIESNMIRDDDYSYIWSSAMPQGYKTKISPDDTSLFGDSTSSGDKTAATSLSENLALDFDCDSWKVDESYFVPPANIEFVDFTETMKQLMDNSDKYQDVKCSACDYLSGDSKTQCLAALKCN